MAKSIEEKARKIAGQRIENGKEFEQMQAAQNQLLEIQAAQKQNLMEQRVVENGEAEQRQLMAQAAEIGAQSAAGNMQLNQATAGTLGRFGLNQPRTSSQTKQQRSQTITRQNVTINNNTTNITNNSVPANIGGPLQGRPIQFQQPTGGDSAGVGKFRNWLNQTFARQEDAAKRRKQEYDRRETSLTKSANKMMRKLEDFGKDITKKLDPRNVGRTASNQLTTLFRLIGIGVIAKNFEKILDWLQGAQDKVENVYIPSIKNFFKWVKGDDDARTPGLVTKLTSALEKTTGKLIFGADYESEGRRITQKGLVKALGEYFWNPGENGEKRGILNKAFDKIKDFLEERSDMAKNAIVVDKSSSLADFVENPGEALKEFLTNITNYLSVLVGGKAAMARIQANVISRAAAAETTASEWNEEWGYERMKVTKSQGGERFRTFKGDETLLNFRTGKGLFDEGGKIDYGKVRKFRISKNYYDNNGELLKGSDSVSMAVSNNILWHPYAAEYKGEVNGASMAKDFAYLHSEAETRGSVLVNKGIFSEAAKNEKSRDIIRHHITAAPDGTWVLVLRKRPIEDIEADIREITPRWKKISDSLKRMGIKKESTLGEIMQYTNLRKDLDLVELEWRKLNTVPLYEQKIVRVDEIREDDEIVRQLSSAELSKAGYIMADVTAIEEAAWGYGRKEDQDILRNAQALKFDVGNKNFNAFFQNGLNVRVRNREATKIDYDFNAKYMTDYDATPEGEKQLAAAKSEEDEEGTGVKYLEGKSAADYESEDADNATRTGHGEVFNVGNAVDYLVSHANENSKHRCAEYVRSAMQAGGLNVDDRPGYAGAYAEYLPKKGWKKIPLDSVPEPGDTVVVKPFVDKYGGAHSYGHIAMYAGQKGTKGGKKSGWISDFFQGTREGYSSRPPEHLVSMWRYGGGPIERDPNYRYSGSGKAYTGDIQEWVDDTKDMISEKAKSAVKKAKKTFSNILSDAKDVIKSAVGGMVHVVDTGAEWETDYSRGLANYDHGVRMKSSAEQAIYDRYSGQSNVLYPSQIINGKKRDEWWAEFFDEKGNLKTKEVEKINPELKKALIGIEAELKKGNGMDELQLQLAANSLDNAMVANAGQTSRDQRLINALVARNQSTPRSQSATADVPGGVNK